MNFNSEYRWILRVELDKHPQPNPTRKNRKKKKELGGFKRPNGFTGWWNRVKLDLNGRARVVKTGPWVPWPAQMTHNHKILMCMSSTLNYVVLYYSLNPPLPFTLADAQYFSHGDDEKP